MTVRVDYRYRTGWRWRDGTYLTEATSIEQARQEAPEEICHSKGENVVFQITSVSEEK